VPVSVAPRVGNRPGANKVSAMFVPIPSQIEDPLERLLTIRDATKGAKKEHNALGADVLLNWAEHATPNVFSTAARAYTRLRLAERHRPIQSLVISNVPGPDFPLYLAGAELVAGFPLGPVMDGAGLNITVMSYRGVLNWGLMACAETVPRVAALASYIPEAMDELLRAANLGPATAVGVAPGRQTPRRSPGRPPRPAARTASPGEEPALASRPTATTATVAAPPS
jgi:diacylglycerol O-acyltransferase / wax synthase